MDDKMKYEWCYDHEQLMWKNGLKCSGCLEDEDVIVKSVKNKYNLVPSIISKIK